MTVPVFRELTEADKKRRAKRLGKGRAVTLPAPPPLSKMSPKQAATEVETRILGSMLRNRDSFAVLVQTMRTVYGSRVQWMTDEQIAQFAREVYRDKVRESTTKAFRKKRANELVIHVGGI